MTEIYGTAFSVNGGNAWGLSASGHATGSPEACAGISAVLYALAGWAADMQERAGEGLAAAAFLEPARAEVFLLARDPDKSIAAESAWGMAVTGLRQIEARYPEQLRVTVKDYGAAALEALGDMARRHGVYNSAEAGKET